MRKIKKGKKMKRKRNESMVERIKNNIARSGKGIRNFIRVRGGSKVKVRFISDFDEAIQVREHDKWGKLGPTPCLKFHFKKECEFCKVSDVRTRDLFAWTVYDYINKEKKILKFTATTNSVVNQFLSAYDTYGTLLDRDFVISRRGTRLDTVYTAMPLDKRKFKKKIKPFTEDEIIEKCIEFSGEIEYDEIEDLPEFDEDVEFGDIEENEEEEEDLEDDDEEDEDLNEDEDEEDETDEDNDEEDEDEDEDFEDEDDEEEEPKKRIKKNFKSRKIKRRK